jgi:hypothetical protein
MFSINPVTTVPLDTSYERMFTGTGSRPTLNTEWEAR